MTVNQIALFAALTFTVAAAVPFAGRAGGQTPPLPERLSGTGLYVPETRSIHPDNLSFTPQYALWSDGASKRRWLYLPEGTAIDASSPNAWEFPIGTKLWKEFSHGRPVETRLIERTEDGGWRFAAYVWDINAEDASLAPEAGLPGHPFETAPGGRYDIPSTDDCRACHEGAAVPVLGISALQLSSDRDELAPHAERAQPDDVGLDSLIARGLLVNAPAAWLEKAPRIETGPPTARAALGYLHANCGHCHNAAGPLADLRLVLAQAGGTIEQSARTLWLQPSEFRLPGAELRAVPGQPDASVLLRRMRSRHPIAQMPPLGTRIVDSAGIEIVENWIQQALTHQQEFNE